MTRNFVEIKNLKSEKSEKFQRLSAEVDNDIVWFEFPIDFNIEARGELFIAMALLEAMISNLPIKVASDIPVSPLLLKSLISLQEIYICWNSDLSKIDILADNQQPPQTTNDHVVSFYSGGVDGSFSYCKHKEEITHLVTLAGFDVVSKAHQLPDLVKKNQEFSSAVGVNFAVVDNNSRQFFNKRKITHAFQYGLTLAGIAVTLGVKKIFIPSSYTYAELFPSGSHPSTDPLWSIEGREIIHDGAAQSRTNKIAFISQNQAVLNNLQVCWKNIAVNCGKCSKCLRTRAALHLLNAKSDSLAPVGSYTELKPLRLTGKASMPFIQDLARLAKQRGDGDIEKTFNHILKKYLIRYYFEGLIKTLFGKTSIALVHKLRGAAWKEHRVNIEGNNES